MSSNVLRLLKTSESKTESKPEELLESWGLENSGLLKILLDAYCVVTTSGKMSLWNYAFENLIEHTYKDIQANPSFMEYFQNEIGPEHWEKTFNDGGVLFKKEHFIANITTAAKDKVKYLVLAAVPIYSQEGVRIGTLVTLRDVSEHDLEIARIENIYKSNVDGLTQVYNKMFSEEWLKKQIEVSVRHKLFQSIILADIDHFKQVNDKFGHQAGDHVLRTVSAIIRDELRESDVVGRFGGEEFIIILANTNQEGVFQAAERVRQRVLSTYLEFQGKQIPISVSLGTYTLAPGAFPNATGEKISFEMIGNADKALYSAKQTGRNRTCQFEKLQIPTDKQTE